MTTKSPRIVLFDTDLHTGVAATRDMTVAYQRECMDNLPSCFPSTFSVQVEFSNEPDDLHSVGLVVAEDRTDHSEADDYLLALSLQQVVSGDNSPVRHESLSPEARVAPSVDQNARFVHLWIPNVNNGLSHYSRIGSSQGEVPS